MLQFQLWKKLLVAAIASLGVVFALPNVIGDGIDKSFLPGKQINLGLDLQGGSHLLLRVDVDAVKRERLENLGEMIRRDFRTEKVRFSDLQVTEETVSLKVRDAEDTAKAKEILVELGNDYSVSSEGTTYRVAFTETGLTQMRTRTVEQSIEIIRRRLDPEGTKEPIIQRQGAERVLVQLPGVDDPEAVKRLLGRTAKLTFQLVDLRMSASEAIQRDRTPPGSILMESANADGRSYVIEKRVMVSGEMLDGATATFDQNNRPAVSFTLNAAGARRFGKVTGENIGRPFAIILDGKVVSAPTIQSQIFGSGQITGDFSVAETNELALVLRAGALPAPLIILEERSIGPGLGADSIAAGEIAALIGLILVAVYMVASYGFFGGLAVAALAVNIILIVAALSALQATLTLPGIAGIVLTMGMAVDANVLVFERIREEMSNGRSAIAAIDGGYQRAISTIVDSNLTTLFAALFLYIFGSGPIKGFAVTLGIGIATSMFTAVMVTRLFIVLWVERKRPSKFVL
ncbi:MAG: protein translocase subunit SecD [Candidatus Puniceispirillum sp.]|nr:protein translocase subunit SecD [Candidatus Puniceispirillum sp.]MBL6775039.1 protein translocase subunit SecD [Candidatus Puniceispirillum sp.]